jgi:hypothetical protein
MQKWRMHMATISTFKVKIQENRCNLGPTVLVDDKSISSQKSAFKSIDFCDFTSLHFWFCCFDFCRRHFFFNCYDLKLT